MKNRAIVVACLLVAVLAGLGGWWYSRSSAQGVGGAKVAAAKTGSEGGAPVAMSPAERAAYAQRRRYLWRQAAFTEIRERAEGGDALAQRRMAEVYEDCIAYRTTLARNVEMLTRMTTVEAQSRPAIDHLFAERKRLCGAADPGGRAGADLSMYWLHRSAKSGDLVAEMRYFGRTTNAIRSGQFVYLLKRVRASGDPDAMFELSTLLSRVEPDGLDAAGIARADLPAFKGPLAEPAWAIAACHRGYDCGRGSRLMHLICLSTLSCAEADFQRYVYTSLSDPTRQAQLTALVRRIDGPLLAGGTP